MLDWYTLPLTAHQLLKDRGRCGMTRIRNLVRLHRDPDHRLELFFLRPGHDGTIDAVICRPSRESGGDLDPMFLFLH